MPFCRYCGALTADDAVYSFCTACGIALLPYASPPRTPATDQASDPHDQSESILVPLPSPPPAYEPMNGYQLSSWPSAPTPPDPLFDDAGVRTARFDSLARAIFHAVNQSVKPCNTGWWEQRKMETFKRACGGYVARDYDRVLKIAYNVVGCSTQTVQERVFLTQAGFATFLEYKIKMDPDVYINSLRCVLSVFAIEGLHLRRQDLPAKADPVERARLHTIVATLSQERRAEDESSLLAGAFKHWLRLQHESPTSTPA